MRSPTAEKVFSGHPDLEVDSAGVGSLCRRPVTPEHLEWADDVVVMEDHHRQALEQSFPDAASRTRITVLGIPDRFDYMSPELVTLLRRSVGERLGLGGRN
jgi:predicted protein tyrosine phosphatase